MNRTFSRTFDLPAHLPACVSRRGRHSLPSPADLTACQYLRTNCRTGSVDMEGPFGRDPARSPLRFNPQSNPSGLRGPVDNALTVAIQPVRAEGLGSQCGSARERFAGRQACGQKTRNNGWNVLRDHPRTPTGVRVPSRSFFPTEPGRPNGLPMPAGL